jgi:hypothetical protein
MEPTREQVEELMAQPLRLGSRRMAGGGPLQMFALPTGGVGVRLDESFMSYSVARKTGSGIAMACVPGEELAQAWLARDSGAVAHAGKGESQ